MFHISIGSSVPLPHVRQETDGSPRSTQAFDQPQEEKIKEDVEEKIPLDQWLFMVPLKGGR